MENENLFVFAVKDDELAKEIEVVVNKHEAIRILRLDNKLLDDLIKLESKQENRPQTLEEFVNNPENKDQAEIKALSLWNMLTNNQNVVECDKRIFTSAEVISKTTLTHSKLNNLLELFDLFGLVEFKKGRYEFSFVFGEKTKQANIYADIIQDITNLNDNITRYKAAFRTDEEKQTAVEELKVNIPQLIIF